MGTWLRTELRPLLGDLLAEERLRREGLFDVDFVTGLRAAHDVGKEDYTEALVALLTFAVWRERFRMKLP